MVVAGAPPASRLGSRCPARSSSLSRHWRAMALLGPRARPSGGWAYASLVVPPRRSGSLGSPSARPCGLPSATPSAAPESKPRLAGAPGRSVALPPLAAALAPAAPALVASSSLALLVGAGAAATPLVAPPALQKQTTAKAKAKTVRPSQRRAGSHTRQALRRRRTLRASGLDTCESCRLFRDGLTEATATAKTKGDAPRHQSR